MVRSRRRGLAPPARGVPDSDTPGLGRFSPRFPERGVDQRRAAVFWARGVAQASDAAARAAARGQCAAPKLPAVRRGSAAGRRPSRLGSSRRRTSRPSIASSTRAHSHRRADTSRSPACRPPPRAAPSGRATKPRSSWWTCNAPARKGSWRRLAGGPRSSARRCNGARPIRICSSTTSKCRRSGSRPRASAALRAVRARVRPSAKQASAAEGSTDWRPHGVRLDMHSGRRTRLGCTVYHVSSDGRWALTPDLRRMSRTQLGYGVHVPEGQVPRNSGAPRDDGLWVSDTRTGECRMLVSLAEVASPTRATRRSAARVRSTPRFRRTLSTPNGTRK